MALERNARPLARCLRCTRHNRIPSRSISATPYRRQEETTSFEPAVSGDPPPPSLPIQYVTTSKGILNREKLSNPRKENLLFREAKKYPIGSRRRRAALASSRNIPFSELPYQCFQEARKILKDDRAGKTSEIEELRAKIDKWNATEVPPEREATKEKRIRSWNKRIEELKILADINDPLVKKNSEDGFGDMNKPIYRHLADQKWRSHKRLVLMQRIEQMTVVPDVLPAIDPTVSTKLNFKGSTVQHGDFVLASTSEKAPMLEIQSYEKGTKLVTIAVVTPDVPNVEKDGFDYRCHFLAANVAIEPTKRFVRLGSLKENANIIQDWLPPYSQKGAPYQRLAVFVLEQPSSVPAEGAGRTGWPDDAATMEAKESFAAAAKEPFLKFKESDATATGKEAVPEASPIEVQSPEPDVTVTETTAEAAGSETTSNEPVPEAPASVVASPEPDVTVPNTTAEAATNEGAPIPPAATASIPPSLPPGFEPPTPYTKPIGPGLSDTPSTSTTPIPERLDVAAIKKDPRYSKREDFILRSFVDRYRLRAIGVDLFRTQWDETTAAVMRRNGIVGGDVEFKRKRVDPLPYQRLKGERYR